MKKAVFNELIELEYPEEFVELNQEENEKYFSGDLLRLSFQDKEKHILLSIAKSKNSFINRLINVASVINGSLSVLEKNLKDYESLGGWQATIMDRISITECFSYVTNEEGIKQYGEFSAFKIRNAFYTIYCICRFEDKEKSKQLFKRFIDSFKYVES